VPSADRGPQSPSGRAGGLVAHRASIARGLPTPTRLPTRTRLLIPARLLLAGTLVAALTGCQTTAEKSAALAKKFHRETIDQHGLSISRPSRYVKVLDATVVHDANGTAAVVSLKSNAAHPLRGVPIAITLTSPQGRVLYQNNGPGLDPSLTSTPLLLPHHVFTWVDDQIQAGAFPAQVTARVGEAAPGPPAPATIVVQGAHLAEDPANEGTAARGTVVNRSGLSQQNLVVFAVARKDGKVVAAGRAVLSSLAARASSPFEVFFIGDPRHAQLELSVGEASA
jgi:hypothetical protein